MLDLPKLEQFRIEVAREGLVHFIFDMPGRTMNVFSNAAIHELGIFASWLKTADTPGVVIRSGKDNAFCAGADLGELGIAYDTIMDAHIQDRFTLAFDHFFTLSHAIRKLETAGKPIAVALAGLALGGGCEFAMGGHYRVLVDDPKVGLGLPESLVGLLPGAGGTQRMPRLIGVPLALDILLDGKRLAGRAALDAGLVHELVGPGEEIASAERWLLGSPLAVQPWDRQPPPQTDEPALRQLIAQRRDAVLKETLGHYPAPLAILDCVEQGFAQPIDAAIRTEMSIFAALIQRAEARNMIQTLFLGKVDFERAERRGTVPEKVTVAIEALRPEIRTIAALPDLAAAGFPSQDARQPIRLRTLPGYWIDETPDGPSKSARDALKPVLDTAARLAASMTEDEQRLTDYAIVRDGDFPAYLGGPFALATYYKTAKEKGWAA